MEYSIKEISEIVGLPTHTLRYYEKEGLIPFIKRDANGNRVYDEKNLGWMDLIMCLRKTDIPLSELREIVELADVGDETIPDRVTILENHRKKMIVKQEELATAFSKIDEKIEYFNNQHKINQQKSEKNHNQKTAAI